jgi:hypothetical protein
MRSGGEPSYDLVLDVELDESEEADRAAAAGDGLRRMDSLASAGDSALTLSGDKSSSATCAKNAK